MSSFDWFFAGMCVALGGQWLGMLLIAWQRQRCYDNFRGCRIGPPKGSYGLPPNYDWRRRFNHENTNAPQGPPPLKFRRSDSNPPPPGREPAPPAGPPSYGWGVQQLPPPPPAPGMRREYICNPTQMAECGGPCWEAQDPTYCVCGALWRDVPRQPPAFTEGRVQRGHGNGGPTTKKPPIVPRPQFPPPRTIREDLWP